MEITKEKMIEALEVWREWKNLGNAELADKRYEFFKSLGENLSEKMENKVDAFFADTDAEYWKTKSMEEIVRDFNDRPKDKEKSIKQLDKTQIALINTAVFDGCKHVKIVDGKPDFSEYSNLKVEGTNKTDWSDYLLSDEIRYDFHISFASSRRDNVRKGLLNAEQLAFWQGYFTAKFGCDFGINKY